MKQSKIHHLMCVVFFLVLFLPTQGFSGKDLESEPEEKESKRTSARKTKGRRYQDHRERRSVANQVYKEWSQKNEQDLQDEGVRNEEITRRRQDSAIKNLISKLSLSQKNYEYSTEGERGECILLDNSLKGRMKGIYMSAWEGASFCVRTDPTKVGESFYFYIAKVFDPVVFKATFLGGRCERFGSATSYHYFGKTLDKVAKNMAYINNISVINARSMMSRDVLHIINGEEFSWQFYDLEARYLMCELSIILLMDLGRVPEAFDYIQEVLSRGLTFSQLFSRPHPTYQGAAEGGVQLLRDMVLEEKEAAEKLRIKTLYPNRNIKNALRKSLPRVHRVGKRVRKKLDTAMINEGGADRR